VLETVLVPEVVPEDVTVVEINTVPTTAVVVTPTLVVVPSMVTGTLNVLAVIAAFTFAVAALMSVPSATAILPIMLPPVKTTSWKTLQSNPAGC
jgi:hypothetical protein